MLPLFHPTWLQWLLVVLAFTQATILCVTVYLHRAQAHRALDIHPALTHVIRAWLWLTTSMSTLEWVCVHRKHHAHCETPEDPHSPVHYGLATVMLKGAALYNRETKNATTIERYGRGAPNDWLETNVYRRLSKVGPVLMSLANVAMFGWAMGLTLSAIQFLWIPVWAAGVINGLAHAKGYRNFSTTDQSRNLLPWGLWIGGEELHNNHHAHATSAKLSYHWWEVDIGWGAIKILETLGLASVKKQARPPLMAPEPALCTPALVLALAQHRMQLSHWYRSAWTRTLQDLKKGQSISGAEARALRLPIQAPAASSELLLTDHPELATLNGYWQQLEALWTDRRATADELTTRLSDWCASAESSGVAALSRFSLQMRRVQATV